MTSTPNTQSTNITGDMSGEYPDGLTLNNSVISNALSNGQAIKTGTTAANTFVMQAYDVDGAAYVTFLTATANNTPSVVIATPTGGTLTIDGASGAEIARNNKVSSRLVTMTISASITAALHEGRTCLLTGTGAAKTMTLPAATGSGNRFKFVVGAVNTSNHVITTTGGDTFQGQIVTCSTTETPDLAQPWTTTAGTTITLNGTTTGGQAIGDVIEVEDILSTKWQVIGFTRTSGTEATPFS